MEEGNEKFGGGMICRICKDNLNPDFPDVVYSLNPDTFRYGWMHWPCLEMAVETLIDLPAKNEKKHKTRSGEYFEKLSEGRRVEKCLT